MTRRLVRELAPDDIRVSVSYPLPGTGFHDPVRAPLRAVRAPPSSRRVEPHRG